VRWGSRKRRDAATDHAYVDSLNATVRSNVSVLGARTQMSRAPAGSQGESWFLETQSCMYFDIALNKQMIAFG
jgi:hypothetical protein